VRRSATSFVAVRSWMSYKSEIRFGDTCWDGHSAEVERATRRDIVRGGLVVWVDVLLVAARPHRTQTGDVLSRWMALLTSDTWNVFWP
jgi:hypothetical protein